MYLKFPIESEYKVVESIVIEAVDEANHRADLILNNHVEEIFDEE